MLIISLKNDNEFIQSDHSYKKKHENADSGTVAGKGENEQIMNSF